MQAGAAGRRAFGIMVKIRQDDVRAMSDAFTAARATMKNGLGEQPAQAGKGERKGTMPATKGERAAHVPADGASDRAAFDRALAERHGSGGSSEHFGDGAAFGAGAQGAAPTVVHAPAMSSPQVDPGAFAQMLADLWTRENGKGAKEVRVRFGGDAWPATGAVLVRNAGGGLDIAVQTARGGGTSLRTGELGARLDEVGLGGGALTVEDE